MVQFDDTVLERALRRRADIAGVEDEALAIELRLAQTSPKMPTVARVEPLLLRPGRAPARATRVEQRVYENRPLPLCGACERAIERCRC